MKFDVLTTYERLVAEMQTRRSNMPSDFVPRDHALLALEKMIRDATPWWARIVL